VETDPIFGNVQLLVALADDVALGDNDDLNLIKMRDHPVKGDSTPSTDALSNNVVHTVGQLSQVIDKRCFNRRQKREMGTHHADNQMELLEFSAHFQIPREGRPPDFPQ
jgi:hypothetical protein